MNLLIGDYIVWKDPQFSGGPFYGGRVTCRPKFLGYKEMSGTIVKDSYGEKTGQHTFTILSPEGKKILRKGRNLYPNILKHTPTKPEQERDELARDKTERKINNQIGRGVDQLVAY